MSVPKLYHYLNILSIDVVAGAMIGSLYIAKVLGVDMPIVTSLALGLTVWMIYTFDHLVDARSHQHALVSQRHSFHKKHFRTLRAGIIIGLISLGVLLFSLPVATVLWGAALGCGVLAYFFTLDMVRVKGLVHKEIMIAVIYTCGLFTGPISLYQGQLSWSHAVLFLQFFILALLNLVVFSFYDREFDKKASFPSLVLSLGEYRSHLLIKALFCLELALAAGNLLLGTAGQVIFLGMVSLLFLIHIFRDNPFVLRHYRWIGDGVFLAPIFYLA